MGKKRRKKAKIKKTALKLMIEILAGVITGTALLLIEKLIR